MNSLAFKIAVCSLILVIGIIGVEGYYFAENIYLPQKETAAFSQNIIPKIVDLDNQISKVDKNLNTISEFIKAPLENQSAPSIVTQTSTDDIMLGTSSIFPKKSAVAGSNDNALDRIYSFSNLGVKLGQDVKYFFADTKIVSNKLFQKKEKRVAGDNTGLEDEYVAKTRALKELSIKGQIFAKDGLTKTDNLKSAVSQNQPPGVKVPVANVQDNITKASGYFLEAGKISDYYDFATGVNLELYPVTKSLSNLIVDLLFTQDSKSYLGALDLIDEKLAKIETELTSYPTDKIPQGLVTTHQDNIQVLRSMADYAKGVRQAISDNKLKTLTAASTKFSSSIDLLSIKVKTEELTFWQDNEIIRNSHVLSDNLLQTKKQFETIGTDTSLPF